MATSRTLSALLMALTISSVIATNTHSTKNQNQDLVVAIEEMQRATFFTFVMLINMAPADLIQGNITFLMPKDRTLAQTTMPENTVVDFLLRHSIPSPLLFEHLIHIPTGSVIPTSKPEFMVNVTNNGRRSFYLDKVRVTSPNICTAGSSIRCHGIDGVLVQAATAFPPPPCSNSSNPAVVVATPAAPPPTPPMGGGVNLTPLSAPPPIDHHQNSRPQKSGSSRLPLPFGGLLLLGLILMMSLN